MSRKPILHRLCNSLINNTVEVEGLARRSHQMSHQRRSKHKSLIRGCAQIAAHSRLQSRREQNRSLRISLPINHIGLERSIVGIALQQRRHSRRTTLCHSATELGSTLQRSQRSVHHTHGHHSILTLERDSIHLLQRLLVDGRTDDTARMNGQCAIEPIVSDSESESYLRQILKVSLIPILPAAHRKHLALGTCGVANILGCKVSIREIKYSTEQFIRHLRQAITLKAVLQRCRPNDTLGLGHDAVVSKARSCRLRAARVDCTDVALLNYQARMRSYGIEIDALGRSTPQHRKKHKK